ncbi:hypothetical protein [Mangrovihabitans endophyticus]|uniref:Uncharacterized protein n=1 Tax=Mangrovihabitans endophyticus TaxID=1751298 RepID=A0A8J3FRB9_9ACTN|nr:hypothetical protein [Mangrovihabitans endophyticus]GGL15903.1 hypothetical protein GCM10012284_58160 [Mangrovihabitans endophyticus]
MSLRRGTPSSRRYGCIPPPTTSTGQIIGVAQGSAACLLADGDLTHGAYQVTEVITALAPAHRTGLVLARARQVLDTVGSHHTSAALRDADDLLTRCATPTGEPPS